MVSGAPLLNWLLKSRTPITALYHSSYSNIELFTRISSPLLTIFGLKDNITHTIRFETRVRDSLHDK